MSSPNGRVGGLFDTMQRVSPGDRSVSRQRSVGAFTTPRRAAGDGAAGQAPHLRELQQLLSEPTVTSTPWRGNSSVVLVDGRDASAVWVWSYSLQKLTKIVCGGEVPPPRTGHAVAVDGDQLYLHGGASTVTPCYPFYRLDIPARCWTPLGGMTNMAHAPQPRVGHSLTAVGGRLVVYGGHPLEVSLSALKQAVSLGFFRLFVFDPRSKAWSSKPGKPMIFSHSAVGFGDGFLLVAGGLECRLDVGDPGLPPVAELNERTFAANVARGTWQVLDEDPPQQELSPAPGWSLDPWESEPASPWLRNGLSPSPQRAAAQQSPPRGRPGPRIWPRLVVLGSEMVLCGGVAVGSGAEAPCQDMWVLDVETRRWRRMETFVDWWPHTPLLAASADTLYATADLQATWQLPVGAKEVFGWSCDKTPVAVSAEAATSGAGRRRASSGSPTHPSPTFVPRTRLDTSGLPAGYSGDAPPAKKTPARGASPVVMAIGGAVQRQAEAVSAGPPVPPPPPQVDVPLRPSRSSSAPWAAAFAGVHPGGEQQPPSPPRPAPHQFHSMPAAVVADDRGEQTAEHDRLAAATFAPMADDSPADPLELLPSMRRPARRLTSQGDGA